MVSLLAFGLMHTTQKMTGCAVQSHSFKKKQVLTHVLSIQLSEMNSAIRTTHNLITLLIL